MLEAFVYCWTDKTTNKLYVGSHKGPSTDGYVCSSKIMLKHYMHRPHDFARQIIASGDWLVMRNFERVLLETVDAAKSVDFYNQHNGGKLKGFLTAEQKIKAVSTRMKRGTYKAWNKGVPHTEESKLKMSLNSLGSGKGIPKTLEHRLAISEGTKKRWADPEKRSKLLKARWGNCGN